MIEDRRDIELRLRIAATEDVGHHKLLREAADEIERLRKYLVVATEKIADAGAAQCASNGFRHI